MARLDEDRDPFHHKGAITLYTISVILISFLLIIHVIGAITFEIRSKKKRYSKSKTSRHRYLSIISSGLSMTCYLIISTSALMAELHIPHCFCESLPYIITNTYAIGKITNYFFFLVRAEAAQGLLNIFPKTLCGFKFPSRDTMFHIIFPIGLFNTVCLYLFIFNIGEPIFEIWTGVCVYKPVQLGCNYLISDDFKLLGYISILVDASLCGLFTFLFYIPIVRVTNMKLKDVIGNDVDKDDYDDPETKEKFIYVLKISLILALINVCSSTICFSILPAFADIWWLWGFDYILNSMCTFLMMGNDRRLLAKIICCICKDNKRDIDANDNSKSDKLSGTGGSSKKPSLKSMETLQVIEQIEMQNKEEKLLNITANESVVTGNITDLSDMEEEEVQEEQQESLVNNDQQND